MPKRKKEDTESDEDGYSLVIIGPSRRWGGDGYHRDVKVVELLDRYMSDEQRDVLKVLHGVVRGEDDSPEVVTARNRWRCLRYGWSGCTTKECKRALGYNCREKYNKDVEEHGEWNGYLCNTLQEYPAGSKASHVYYFTEDYRDPDHPEQE